MQHTSTRGGGGCSGGAASFPLIFLFLKSPVKYARLLLVHLVTLALELQNERINMLLFQQACYKETFKYVPCKFRSFYLNELVYRRYVLS